MPADAGPFHLGDLVVRASIRIDALTGRISIVSDQLPRMIDTVQGINSGIPTDLRTLQVTLSRPGFMVNPTDCAPLSASARQTSTLGAEANATSPFYASGCGSLRFTPKLNVSVGKRGSQSEGAGVDLRIAYPRGAQGRESWMRELKLDVPHQLPARLPTIQQACLRTTFETNPAACPARSIVGRASMRTAILAATLAGPVYFVSNGASRFPEVVVVLQGEGVTIDLHGETHIDSKTRSTSVTFRQLPDVPFETIEVKFPAGEYSQFGVSLPAKAKGSFCGQKLIAPAFLEAQNGRQLHERVRVSVAGCPRPTRAKKAHARSRRAPHRGTRALSALLAPSGSALEATHLFY
jgi:hypothetical protein